MCRSLKWFLPAFKRPVGQVPYLQEPGIRPYPEPFEPPSHTYTLCLQDVGNFCLQLSEQHFCAALVIFPELSTPVILGQE
jgi:hypothetical protein